MSLDVAKLEKVRELAGGIVQARCPACAEGGGDRKGQHLRIYPDGRYGCCIHPKDGEHRKRIYALAGSSRRGSGKPGTFSLRLKTAPAAAAARSVKAALVDCGVRSAECGMRSGDGRNGKNGTNGIDGTLGTAKTESENGGSGMPASLGTSNPPADDDFGTLGTPSLKSRAYAREGSPSTCMPTYMCKDWESGVPSVPKVPGLGVAEPPSAAAGGQPTVRLPFLTADGTLSIPFDSPERYHWWKPGERLSAEETLKEVNERTKDGVSI